MMSGVYSADLQFEKCMTDAEARQSGIFVELGRVYTENSSSNQFRSGTYMKMGFEGVLRAGKIAKTQAILNVSIVKSGILYYNFDYDLCSVVTNQKCPLSAPRSDGKSVRVTGSIMEQIPEYMSDGECLIKAEISVGDARIGCFTTTIKIIK